MNQYQQWLELKEKIRSLTADLHVLEGTIWLKAQTENNLNLKGSKTFEDGLFKVTITHGNTYKIDQKKAAELSDVFIEKALTTKYEFNKAKYEELFNKVEKDLIDEILTITPSKPQFKIVKEE